LDGKAIVGAPGTLRIYPSGDNAAADVDGDANTNPDGVS